MDARPRFIRASSVPSSFAKNETSDFYASRQDQAGYIPNRCGAQCKNNAFWQLYKMRAVYRMMEDHEALVEMP